MPSWNSWNSWKSPGIWWSLKNPGKVLEFCQKSWNFVKICKSVEFLFQLSIGEKNLDILAIECLGFPACV
jgi:hypothetical protein